jgi:hypothetical protein
MNGGAERKDAPAMAQRDRLMDLCADVLLIVASYIRDLDILYRFCIRIGNVKVLQSFQSLMCDISQLERAHAICAPARPIAMSKIDHSYRMLSERLWFRIPEATISEIYVQDELIIVSPKDAHRPKVDTKFRVYFCIRPPQESVHRVDDIQRRICATLFEPHAYTPNGLVRLEVIGRIETHNVLSDDMVGAVAVNAGSAEKPNADALRGRAGTAYDVSARRVLRGHTRQVKMLVAYGVRACHRRGPRTQLTLIAGEQLKNIVFSCNAATARRPHFRYEIWGNVVACARPAAAASGAQPAAAAAVTAASSAGMTGSAGSMGV